MKLITYAQNQEDVMLYRALHDVKNGFYIDVGAQHPSIDSVTKFFYDRGWTGINIDPMPQWFDLLEAERTHDTNLRLAVSGQEGEMTFYGFEDTGLSTSDAEIAKRHQEAGYKPTKIKVATSSLDSICAKHEVKQVHFLKIDVEGAELSVIEGFSFKDIRPWVVVVESVEPVAQREGDSARETVPTFESWEPLLLDHDYEFAHWDGLNRFYVAKEHVELIERLKIPANPLDGFTRYSDILKQDRILQLEQEHRSLLDATDVNTKRREFEDIKGLVATADNRLKRIAELEQDNARLVGRESAMEAQLREHVTSLEQKLQRLGDLQHEHTHIGEIRKILVMLEDVKGELAELGGIRKELSLMDALRKELSGLDGLRQELIQVGELREDLSVVGELRSELSRMDKLREELSLMGELRSELSRMDKLREELSLMGELRGELSRMDKLREELSLMGELRSELSRMDKLREELSLMGELRGELSRMDKLREELSLMGELRGELSRMDKLREELSLMGELRGELSQMDKLREGLSLLLHVPDELSRLNGLVRVVESSQEQVRLSESRLKAEQRWSRDIADQVKSEKAEITEQREHLRREQAKIREAKGRMHQLTEQMRQLQAQRDRLEASLRMVTESRSWRMTRPFRRMFRHDVEAPDLKVDLAQRTKRGLLRRAMRRILFAGIRFLDRHRRLHRISVRFINLIPHARHRLHAFRVHNATYIYPGKTSPDDCDGGDQAGPCSAPETEQIKDRLNSFKSKK